MLAFGAPHLIQLAQRFAQTRLERQPKPFLIFHRFRHRAIEPRNHTGQAKERNHVDVCGCRRTQHQGFRGAQVCLRKILVDLNGSGRPGFGIYINLQMPAMNALADDLPQSQVVKVKALRQTQLQVEEAMVNAFHCDAHGPALLLVARLRVTGHRQTLGMLSSSCRFFAHEGSCGNSRLACEVCVAATMSSSANCRSCSRAYVPPRASNSECVPLSRIWPSSKTRIFSARRIVARR